MFCYSFTAIDKAIGESAEEEEKFVLVLRILNLGVDENNEILSFFLPSLIVKSCKSTVRFCDSFTAIDKASGEQKKLKKKKKRKEKKKSLFLLCGF